MLQQAIDTIKGKVLWRSRYENFIGGAWVPPAGGEYFVNLSPITGKPIGEVARGKAADIELAIDAAHRAKGAWGRTSSDRARQRSEQDR